MQASIPAAERALLGPLANLLGEWVGDTGEDLAPGAQRNVATSHYRERVSFTWLGRVDNHEQILYGLEQFSMMWRLGSADPFHQERAYWLWDAARSQVVRSFIIPRGVAVNAGGTVAADASEWTIAASLGSLTYGICVNQFLHEHFQTTGYERTMSVGEDSWSYDETTTLHMPERPAFAHRDRNTLRRA